MIFKRITDLRLQIWGNRFEATDLRLQIWKCGSQKYNASCKVIHDNLGFQIPWCGLQIPGTGFKIPTQWIPDSTSQCFLDFGYHEQMFPGFRNPNYVTWGKIYKHKHLDTFKFWFSCVSSIVAACESSNCFFKWAISFFSLFMSSSLLTHLEILAWKFYFNVQLNFVIVAAARSH